MSSRRYYPGIRGRLGDWAFYSTLMSLESIVATVNFASEIHKNKQLSRLIQRELQEGRARDIAEYLHNNDDRFFNSLVVAVYGGKPGWHSLQISSKEPDAEMRKAIESNRESIGFLSLSGEEKVFAVDGQHRLAGIKEALKSQKGLGKEEASIIFVAHHATSSGERRTRKLFTTLNKTARKVSKPEIIALDESDAMAIATRFLIEEHRFFNKGAIDILSKSAGLPKSNRTHLATLINVYDILQILFKGVRKGLPTRAARELSIYRPSDEEIDTYCNYAAAFFEKFANCFPPLQQYLTRNSSGETLSKWRTDDGGHVLFRPVGLLVFAEAFVALENDFGESEALKRLSRAPVSLGDEPYRSTIWDASRSAVVNARKPLCRDLLVYMLGGPAKGGKSKLRNRLASALGKEPKGTDLPPVIV